MNGIAWAAYNNGTTGIMPWGRWMPDSVTVPGYWVANSSDYTWDFAVVEWGPSNAPGDQVGWFGTQQDSTSYQYMYGYSGDGKPPLSMWFRGGYFSSIDGAQYKHYIDIVGGDSGACFYNPSYHCTCTQSTETSETDPFGTYYVNRCRRWDSATYNFFDAYGWNWP